MSPRPTQGLMKWVAPPQLTRRCPELRKPKNKATQSKTRPARIANRVPTLPPAGKGSYRLLGALRPVEPKDLSPHPTGASPPSRWVPGTDEQSGHHLVPDHHLEVLTSPLVLERVVEQFGSAG